MQNNKKKAVVLLSGGIDSSTTAVYAIDEGFDIYAVTFFYGQKHSVEIDFVKKLCDCLKIDKRLIINIPAEIFSSSSLSSASGIEVPKNSDLESAGDIPSTYVPGRNILFLSYALSFAESIDARDIFIGANAVDYSGYPDCRPEFIDAFQAMANIGTKAGVSGDPFRINAPLLKLKKSEIIKLGVKLGLDYSLTHSCYDPDGNGSSCGKCDSCKIRMKGFKEAGVPDPTKYVKSR
ncbi:MAG: 7-cyano-7-deazaguanine synthase QueC [Spirochaetes bacterium]|nr:7-cyano-7-deazaguanine synthase QueC [Spirochaetota bacterium]